MSNRLTTAEELKLVNSCIQLVRQGSFITIFNNAGFLEKLRSLTSSSGWPSVVSRAILAETYDQVGLYGKAEGLTGGIAQRTLDELEKEINKPNPERDIVRAQAWLILQCAVSHFRREDRHKEALELLDQTIALIARNKGEAVRSQHIQSLFYFWRGRIHTVQYEFEEADEDFQEALRVADRALDEKLRQVEELPGGEREKRRSEHVAASTYILATALGFGLGQLRQLEGRLVESLQFLRVAVPLSRGSVDLHRRGFAHLLMGTALRSRSHHDSQTDQLDAEEHLLEARRLFGEPQQGGNVRHHLHLARTNHQLALLKYNQQPLERVNLKDAEALNERAETESHHESCRDYRDPVLDYGIAVLRSLIKTGLGEYQAAQIHAGEAVAIIEKRHLPRGTHGWAWVAKGMALAEGVQSREQRNEVQDLQHDFIDGQPRHTERLSELRLADAGDRHDFLPQSLAWMRRPASPSIQEILH